MFLIAGSSVVDYVIGLSLENENRTKIQCKLLLSISLVVNIGVLLFFKYFNFFVEGFVDAFRLFGHQLNISTLRIILPVGISFYTFQTLSYTIDVYRGNLKSTRNLITFSAFVSFFPQLVAGPIERASNLLPQFNRERKFEYSTAIDGCKQILRDCSKKWSLQINVAMLSLPYLIIPSPLDQQG